MEYIMIIGIFFISFGLIFGFVVYFDDCFNLTSSIICIISILIGFTMTIYFFLYNQRIEKQFDEILSKNESIIIIETETNNDDILRRVINNYDNYEPIYEDFGNEGKTKIILVKPLEMRFIKKDLFEREFKTTIDDEEFWEKQKQKQIKNNIENGSKYYLDDEVIFKQFIQGEKNHWEKGIVYTSLKLHYFYNAFYILVSNFNTIQIVIENKNNLDLKNNENFDISQLIEGFYGTDFKLVKEEQKDEKYIYTFSKIEEKPDFLIKK